MYRTALARSHRPRRFSELVGQDHVASTLRGAVESERVAHAYLFSGPRGIGKTTAARVLAMALNCPNREDGEPCGRCESCESIWSGRTALDVVEIDAASNRGVDDARDLRERAMYAPSDESRYKVYIVDEAHMLTREAWNALLKILEEPPPRVIFVFATTEPEKIRQTADPVMSRCQRFDFRRVSVADLLDRLETVLEREGVTAEDGALLPIARRAEGGVRDALSLLDQVLSFSGDEVSPDDVRRMLGLVAEEKYLDLVDLVARADRAGVFPFVQRLLDEGYDLGEFVRGLGEAWRLMLALRMDPDGAATELSETDRAAFRDAASTFSETDLLRYLTTTVEFESSGRLRRSTQPRLQLEALLLRLVSMMSFVDFAELVSAVESGVPPVDEPARPAAAAASEGSSRKGNAAPNRPEAGSKRSEADEPPPPDAGDPADETGDSAESSTPDASGPKASAPTGTVRAAADTPAASTGTTSGPPQDVARAWQETLTTLRGKGLGGEVVALAGASVTRVGDDAVRVVVPPGLIENIRGFLEDPTRSGTLRRELARRLEVDPAALRLGVEATGRPERLTAAAAQRHRLDRMMDADPNLRDAVQTLDLRLKE